AAQYGSCDIEGVAASWEHLSKVLAADGGAGSQAGWARVREDGQPVLQAPARPPLMCKWAQLGAGMFLCAAKSGGSLLFYAVCSYGVFCGSCSGGVADVLCFR
ncbi:MAG TPA: hypothetical protein VMT60_03485, partial [Candidatus Bathyarchaeia archaeon]|nr:hypothetical protein [Candidatus Bathyarchaeia archaeon]